MVTTFVDIDRGRLLDVVPGRSGAVVGEWVQARPFWWPDQITVATIDAFAGYAAAIRDTLPTATLVVDHFHTILLAWHHDVQIAGLPQLLEVLGRKLVLPVVHRSPLRTVLEQFLRQDRLHHSHLGSSLWAPRERL